MLLVVLLRYAYAPAHVIVAVKAQHKRAAAAAFHEAR